MKRVNLELPDEMYVAVRAAAGDVPVNRWLRRAVEQALAPMPRIAATAKMSPAERDEAVAKLDAFRASVDSGQSVPGPNVENIRSSRQAKDFKPYPKKAR